MSNPTHQGTREMWRIVQDVGILRVFFVVDRCTLGPLMYVACYRMSEDAGVGLHFTYFPCVYSTKSK